MKEYKSVRHSFGDCSFGIRMPKITVVGNNMVTFSFHISFMNKPHAIKCMVLQCSLTDKLGNKAVVNPDEQSNFMGDNNVVLVIEERRLLKSDFTIDITILTETGEHVDISYSYDRNKPIVLNAVSLADMTDEEKRTFITRLNETVVYNQSAYETKNEQHEYSRAQKTDSASKHAMDEYISAVAQEMYYLKHHGGKRHKVTDGRLLTSEVNEFCYSFELETELYLSDDAPVAVIKGVETVYGTVIVCDGFQIIVSLEHCIGNAVPSAQISVEPWKILEKLNDRLKQITPHDHIAWSLYHDGPVLAAKKSDLATIQRGQKAAVMHAIKEDITVIWGPPGTGKTFTMAKMTECFVKKGKTVLIVSHSNISVDNVVKQIINQFSKNDLAFILPRGKVLRYGYVRDAELAKYENCVAFKYALNHHPKLKEKYEDLEKESASLQEELKYKQDIKKAERRKEVEKVLKKIRTSLKEEAKIHTANAEVVATTVSKLYVDPLFDCRKYDVVMFDEVSMAYVPQLLCAASYAKEKFICVGDFRQLSPIVQSDKAKDILQRDIFSFLNINKHGEIYNHPWMVMLNEQRRMHPHISRFSNLRIYKGLLKDHESVCDKWNSVVDCEPLASNAIALLDLAGTFCAAGKNADNSRFNILSAVLSFAVALKSESAQQNLAFKNEEKVGIITPYAAQTQLIRSFIKDYQKFLKDTESSKKCAVSCATVHQFQGSERNVVIFDAVESYPFVKPGWLVSKNENGSVLRLINVALTRARCKFITLANTRFWYNKFQDTENTYYQLLGHIKKYDTEINTRDNTFFELIQQIDFGPNIDLFADSDSAFMRLCADLNAAKKQIVITLPTDKLNPCYEHLIAELIQKKSKEGVVILGKAKDVAGLNDTWKGMLFKSKDASFPLISIDKRITWYGFAITELFFNDKNYTYFASKSPIFRIKGEHANEMIYSLCDLDYRSDEKGIRTKLSEKDSIGDNSGLSDYVYENIFCKQCGSGMRLSVGQSGKCILKCSSCQTYDLLSTYDLNKYLDATDARCAICHKDLYAKLGPYGLFAKCSDGHITKLKDLF